MADTDDTYRTEVLQRLQQTLGPLFLILILYYGYSYLTYETTIKRSLYEAIVGFLPEKVWQLMQSLSSRITGLSLGHGDGGTRLPDKSGSLQKTYSGQGISSVVQRARSLSGFDKFVSPAVDVSFSGLGNWDNSCFQNSVLQGLASLSAFKLFVETGWHTCVVAGVEAPALEGLQSFLSQLQEEIQGRRTIWPPSVLRSMNTWQQQDAQEYLSKILDSIEKELTRTQKAISRRLSPDLACLRQKASAAPESASVLDHIRLERDETRDRLPLSSLEGFLSQKLRCQHCGFSEGVSLTSFNCLTLNLGLGGSCYLETLLDTHFEPEMIDGVECDECTRLAHEPSTSQTDQSESIDEDEASGVTVPDAPTKKAKILSTKAKRILFGRLPQNLAIHINRSIFDDWGNQRKNNSFVEFPAQLKIWGDWVEEFGEEEIDVYATYELRCIINHSGRHDNGHYVTCGKRGKDWFLFNDEIVTRISEADVLTRGNVFMLFYEMIECAATMEASTPKSDSSQIASPIPQADTAVHEPVTKASHSVLSEAPTSAISS